MPKKRIAEDTPEQALTAKASKKRRVSHGDSVEPEARKTGPSAAQTADAAPATPNGKKKEKKDKKEKKKAKAATEEDSALEAEVFDDEPVATPASTKKSKKKSLDDGADADAVAPSSTDDNAISAKLKAKRDRKEKRRQEREQQLATDLAKAERDVEKKGNKDPEALARLASLKKQHKKAKKDVQKVVATSKKRKNNAAAGVDIDALRAEVRQEVLQEIKQQEEARKEKSKKQRQKKRKAAKDSAEPQAEDMEVDAPAQADEDDADEPIVNADDASKDIQSDGHSKGLVYPPGLCKGAKPTSDSLQMAQLDHSMASIDPSRFSESLQEKIQHLQALEWRLSKAVGGRILAIGPIFSADQESIIIAYPTSIRVYSIKTSLVLRTLDLENGHVAGITLNSEPKQLLIASTTGSIERWNWNTGEKLSSHSVESPAVALSVVSQANAPSDYVYTVEKGSGKEKKQFHLHIHDFTHDTSKTILRASDKIMTPYVFEDGKTIVVAAGKRLIVGVLQSDSGTSLTDTEYLWHELDCPETINCFDIYHAAGSTSDAHVAVGTNGPIYLYRNLISQLQSIAKRKATIRPSVQKLHWHRFPVGTVKFSKDGNYLISGGFETVLCKWQLDTGVREDLPHMTAPIEGLVVSPDGASYAVRLGNNSLIILSTLDFEAKFAIAGPALPATFDTANEDQAVKAYPTILRPQSAPQQLLIATPSSSSMGASSCAVYLQTLDARTGVQMEKQALTRTNVTDRVSDPQGRVIGEPDVTHLAISTDGRWLATVETWRPPISDLDFAADNTELTATSKARRETYLKIWSRNEDDKTWQLTSRIDSPHGNGPLRTGKILDLTTDAHGFVTVGTEGEIKLWRQQNRYRNGIQIKDKTGTTLTSWHCARTVAAPSPPVVDDATDVMIAASLALSADGTLLLAVLKYRRSTVVRLINHIDGSIIVSRTDLPVDVLVGAAIVDRYLVILSETLTVWDIVRGGLQFSYRLRTSPHSPKTFKTFSHLAAHDSGTFAIAVPNEKGQGSEIIIFNPASPDPQAVREVPTLVRALLSDSNKGFFVVDAVAQLKHLQSPQTSISSLLALPSSDSAAPAAQPVQQPLLPLFDLPLREAEETGDEGETVGTGASKARAHAQDGARFTQDSLAEVFGSRDTTMGDFMKVAALAMRGRAAA